MSIFEFLMVLVSLIIGLGIAELLSGIANVIRNRETIKIYWVHGILVVIVFLALLQQWWEIWGLHTNQVWTFTGLLMMLGGPIGLFLISHLIFPEQLANANLKTYYYDKMRPALLIAVCTVIIASSFRPLIFGHDFFHLDNISSIFLVVIFTFMAIIRNQIFHSISALLLLGLILADILIPSMQIQQ